MKNTVKRQVLRSMVITALAAAIGFSFTSCLLTGLIIYKVAKGGSDDLTVIAQGIQVKETSDDINFTDSIFTGDFGHCNFYSSIKGGSYYHAYPVTQIAPGSSNEPPRPKG
jgi:hypothetical protein